MHFFLIKDGKSMMSFGNDSCDTYLICSDYKMLKYIHDTGQYDLMRKYYEDKEDSKDKVEISYTVVLENAVKNTISCSSYAYQFNSEDTLPCHNCYKACNWRLDVPRFTRRKHEISKEGENNAH